MPTVAVLVLAAGFGAADQYLGSWPGHGWAVDASLAYLAMTLSPLEQVKVSVVGVTGLLWWLAGWLSRSRPTAVN